MRKISYIALSLYLLLAGLSAIIANLMIPNTLMAVLALIASLGIFLEACIPAKKSERAMSFSPVSSKSNHPHHHRHD